MKAENSTRIQFDSLSSNEKPQLICVIINEIN